MMVQSTRLSGKVALVTGAGSGIGAEIARRFAAEGALVTVADLPQSAGSAVAEEIGAAFHPLDVTSENAWSSVVANAAGPAEVIDILVNSAGIVGDVVNGALDRMSYADWRAVMAVNLDGTFLGCREVLKVMGPARRGAIVNIASVAAYYPTSQNAAYGASKAAVMQLTKTVAAFGAQGGARIRCNSVHPGQITTPMLGKIREERRLRTQGADETVKVPEVSRIPLGEGEPGDVASLVTFLASDEAKYITGAEFTVDGGWRLLR